MFGYKAHVVDDEDGLVLDYSVEIGNPGDGPQLVPAIERVKKQCGCAPDAVTADRGYGSAKVDNQLPRRPRRQHRCYPRPGEPSAARRVEQDTETWRELIRWRTGAEGRIACLKRQRQSNRSHLTTIEGTRTTCGHGVLAHNLTNSPDSNSHHQPQQPTSNDNPYS